MSRRSDVLHFAQDWLQWVDFRAMSSELIYFFQASGAEQVPTQAEAEKSLKESTGVWIGSSKKHWCGIFCCAILRDAGVNARWTLKGGKIVGDGVKLTWGRPGIQPGDVAMINKSNHHFLILGVDEKAKRYTTLEGNTAGQMVRKRTRPFFPTDSSEAIYGYYKIL